MKKNRHDRRAEAAKAQKRPDPFRIFMNAERFRIADLTLRQHPDPRVAVAVGTPSLILSAFASELYLKCLIFIESELLAHGHDLRDLFKRLTPQAQRNVEERWNEYVASPQRQRIYAAIKSIEGHEIPTDLDWALRNGGGGFVNLRYLHESESGSKFLLGEFPSMIRVEILLHRPQWSNLAHGPMQPIPGFEEEKE